MPETGLRLVLGDYNTSAASLQTWLVLRLAGLDFEELSLGELSSNEAALAPIGRVPRLLADDQTIWESLAIAEFAAELHPEIWPTDPRRRALARAVAAEMHGGFRHSAALLPLDMVSRFTAPGQLTRPVRREIARTVEIWTHCRRYHANEGPFLFGDYSVADAMFAPMAARFVTHGIDLPSPADDYVDAVLAWPPMTDWQEAALVEVERKRTGDRQGPTHARRTPAPEARADREPHAAPRPAAHAPDGRDHSDAEAARKATAPAAPNGQTPATPSLDEETATPSPAEVQTATAAEPSDTDDLVSRIERRAAELDRSGEPTGNSPELTRDDDAWRHPPPRMPAEPSPDEKAPEAGAPPAPALPAERPPSPVERREAIRHGPTIKPIGTGIQRRR